ncbi:hypothetical protein FVEG_07408 [Fusarium verticillioides 7600]|uniref:Uncharacterized protein n=1 Tax=Gibberella moniliformis (strain M3125 / FGSC 7600) TaxID=334819 RepID=W7M6P0_GIBM7|nr:hypothetical protein FVEG_07408 [Fusarium verticillioides 7600]EWG47248.1 hypothetical protein FVEG_07408 [Fusarium verticillioides 7600]
MAPAIVRSLRSASSITQHAPRAAEAFSTLSGRLLEGSKVLLARDDKGDDKNDRHKPSQCRFFFLFALIGVAFVCTGIWFFFWAKNGGFQFKETDWDDYKSTVLRRTGPNGTILSNATRPTNLGGGSVYKDVDDDNTTVVTESTTLTGITAGASDIGAREKRRRKQEKRDRERAKKGKKTSRHVGEAGVEDEEAELAAKKELRSYRHERPARVGGLNKESEGSEWDGSTNPGTESNVSTNLLSDRQTTPTTTPTKATGGIRKVYSTADRRENREAERMRAEARRLREAGRAARRDFSYQRAESYTRADSQVSESLLDGSQVTRTTDDSGDLGTKSYHHPMPELRELERERAREERRARRAQREYRRGRGEEC